jgi:hypothetical protein
MAISKTDGVAAFLTQTVELDDKTSIKFEIWDTVCSQSSPRPLLFSLSSFLALYMR